MSGLNRSGEGKTENFTATVVSFSPLSVDLCGTGGLPVSRLRVLCVKSFITTVVSPAFCRLGTHFPEEPVLLT